MVSDLPVVMTHNSFLPPQMLLSPPAHPVLQELFAVLESKAGNESPHQHLFPSDKPSTSFLRPRQICWQEPGLVKGPSPWSSRGALLLKHPMVSMVRASTVAVGEGIWMTEEEDQAAEATDMNEVAAARTDKCLMESMMGELLLVKRKVKSLRQQRRTVGDQRPEVARPVLS